MINDTRVYSSRSADKFVVRFPEGMRDRVQEIAKESHRSMNSEIIARLQDSLSETNPVTGVSKFEGAWVPQVGQFVILKDNVPKSAPESKLAGTIFTLKRVFFAREGYLAFELSSTPDTSQCVYANFFVPIVINPGK